MKVWLVKTDDIEFDMYQGAVIVAPTKEKAENIAWATFTKNPWMSINVEDVDINKLDFNKDCKVDFPQKWHAEEIDLGEEKIILGDYKAG
ncbi:hypothetical protein GBO92_01145 [Pediococcus pentosaceus]|uniref:hypothetical protein n=1 Tax=Pediococcus pentosaceus TaxID=1255 RepID=UPI00132BBA94|nr:hypothetical protein [Pediococcus pentosaceus]KAF0444213.1 hypothetical protein GBO92_01145 [Pediococcus pentosaceus]